MSATNVRIYALCLLGFVFLPVEATISIPQQYTFDYHYQSQSPRANSSSIGRYYGNIPGLARRQDFYMTNGAAALAMLIDRADLNLTITWFPPECDVEAEDLSGFASLFDFFKTAKSKGSTVINNQECNLWLFSYSTGEIEGCILDDNITVVYLQTYDSSNRVNATFNILNFCPNAKIDARYFDFPDPSCSPPKKMDLVGPLLKQRGPRHQSKDPIPPVLPQQFSSDILIPKSNGTISRLWVNQKYEQVRYDQIDVVGNSTEKLTLWQSLVADKQRGKLFKTVRVFIAPPQCQIVSYSPTMFNFYLWLPDAKYTGNHTVDNKTCSMYQFQATTTRVFSACFSLEDNPTLLWASDKDTTSALEFFFYNFCAHTIDPQMYDLPSFCNATLPLQTSSTSGFQSLPNLLQVDVLPLQKKITSRATVPLKQNKIFLKV